MTRKALILLLLLALACATVAATRVLGQEGDPEQVVGQLLIDRGLVKVRRLGAERVYRQKGLTIPIRATDVIHSGADTRASLALTETGELVTIYSDTHVKVSDLRIERGLFVLNAGKALFSLLRDLAVDRDVRVQTRTATFGVKGTQFIVGAKEEESFALTLEGEVAATPSAQPEREIRIKPGEMYYLTDEVVPDAAIAVEPEAQERIVTEDGLGGLRKAAGLPEDGARAEGPPTVHLRAGIGAHEVLVPFRNGGEHEATVSGGALLLSLEWKFWGPVMVELAGIRGGVNEVAIDTEDTGDSPSGDMTTIAALAGVRGDFGGWFSTSFALGPFRHWTVIRGGGGDDTINVDGLMARATADYVLDNQFAVGLVLYLGSGEATGSGPDGLRSLGFTVEDAEVSYLGLTVGGRF